MMGSVWTGHATGSLVSKYPPMIRTLYVRSSFTMFADCGDARGGANHNEVSGSGYCGACARVGAYERNDGVRVEGK